MAAGGWTASTGTVRGNADPRSTKKKGYAWVLSRIVFFKNPDTGSGIDGAHACHGPGPGKIRTGDSGQPVHRVRVNPFPGNDAALDGEGSLQPLFFCPEERSRESNI